MLLKRIQAFGAIALVGIAVLAGTSPAKAEGSMASKIGEKVIGSIISQALGIGVDSIFGGPAAATPEDVSRIVSEQLGDYRIGTIVGGVNGLVARIAAYNRTDSVANRHAYVAGVVVDTGNLQGAVQEAIEHQGKFWEAFPHYVYATNVRLAFLAEQVTTTQQSGQKEAARILASAARDAVKKVSDFWKYDFIDNRHIQCLGKNSKAVFFTSRGSQVPDKFVHGGRTVCITDAPYIVYEAVPYSKTWHQIIEDRRVFKRPGHNEWYFTYKRSARDDGDGGYVLSNPYPSSEKAEAARITHSFAKYPTQLGEGYVQSIMQWMVLVQTSGFQEIIHDLQTYKKILGVS